MLKWINMHYLFHQDSIPNIYRCSVLNMYWFRLFGITNSTWYGQEKQNKNNPTIYYLGTCNNNIPARRSFCVFFVWCVPEQTDDLRRYDAHYGVTVMTSWILRSSSVNYWARYFRTFPNMTYGQNAAFYADDDFMSNWRRHKKCFSNYPSPHVDILWVTFGLNHWMITDVKPSNMVGTILTVHCLNQVFQKSLWFQQTPWI